MDLGVPELLIILVIVIVLFGTGRVVDIAHDLGSAFHQFRQGLNSNTKPVDKTK